MADKHQMKSIKKNAKQHWNSLKDELFKSEDLVINWSDFRKGILLGFFGLMAAIGQLIWYVIHYNSYNGIWLSGSYFPHRMTTLSITCAIYMLTIYVSLKLKTLNTTQIIASYFFPFFFGTTLLYGGYTIGLYSPATMSGTVNIILVGLVFYNRKLITMVSIPIVLMWIYLGYQTYHHHLPYAPVFSDYLNQSDFYSNKFWIRAMAELYLPILVVSALLFEVLLSQWRRREKNIEHMSQTDALTNVYNRRYISEHMTRLEANQTPVDYAVVLLDLDHFKQINDQYGHDMGDVVLKRVAHILKETVRETDVVGRFGGEEFILILRHKPLETVLEVAERCRQAIENENIESTIGESVTITASFGVALSKLGKTKEEVTRLADQALYDAKAQGRNRICIA